MPAPYRVPYINVALQTSYPVASTLGFSSFIMLRDIWGNVRMGTQPRDTDVDEPPTFDVSELLNPNYVVGPEDVAADSKGLKLRGAPALVLEANTGAMVLRPIPIIRSTCLTKVTRWNDTKNCHPTNPGAVDTNREAGEWAQGSQIGPTGGNNLLQSWEPLASEGEEAPAHLKSGRWSEAELAMSPHPASPFLYGADKTDEIKCIQYNELNSGAAIKPRWLQAKWALPKEPSFFLAFRLEPQGKAEANKEFTPYMDFVWGGGTGQGPFALRFSHLGSSFTDNYGASVVNWKDIAGLGEGANEMIFGAQDKGWRFVLVQTVGNAIVIQNAHELVGDAASKEGSKGYAHFRMDGLESGIKVPNGLPRVAFAGANAQFAFFNCRRALRGTFRTIEPIETGYTINNLSVDTHKLNDNTLGVIDDSASLATANTAYKLEIEYQIDPDQHRTDRSPEAYSFRIKSNPSFMSASFTYPNALAGGVIPGSRIISATLNLSAQDQTASVVVDNRDGVFKQLVGVYPAIIETGWYRQGSGTSEKQRRFTGFLVNVQMTKKSAGSFATLQFVGRKLQLEDAQAVNLPIYDGYYADDAFEDLLSRGGYAHATLGLVLNSEAAFDGDKQDVANINIGNQFQLSLPLPGEQPRYNFTMGTSIWSCIAEIAKVMGFWYFFDANGRLHIVNPFVTAGGADRTYREVPSGQFDYDECYALSSIRDTANVRNAVMVVGLDTRSRLPVPLVSVRKATLTATATRGYVPWYRWVFITDPKLNNRVDWVADRTYNNSRRPRLTGKFRVWGDPTLQPLDMVSIELLGASGANAAPGPSMTLTTDNVDLAAEYGQGTPRFRVLTIADNLDFTQGSYTSDIEVEYHDPDYAWAAWWDKLANQ